MRFSTVLFALAAFGCSKEDAAPAVKKEPPKVIKKPVDKAPLPPLAADPGGATGSPIWETGFGGLGLDIVRALAVDKSDNVYVSGYFDGEIDLGPAGKHKSVIAPKPPGAGSAAKLDKDPSDAFLVKLDPDGKIAWGQTFGGGRSDDAKGVAVNGDNVVVVGNFSDEIKIGEFTHKAVNSDDLFVAAFNGKGEAQWLWTSGGIDSDGANTVAAMPDGGWIVGGSYFGDAEFGKFPVKSKGGSDAVLIKLSAGGDVEWVKSFGGRYNDSIHHVGVDARGNIYIQGVFRDVAQFDSAGAAAPVKSVGGVGDDIVVAKYDLNGDHIWSLGFGSKDEDAALGLVVDPAGHVTVVGSFDKSITFPGDPTQHNSLGESDIYITRFAPDGKFEWTKTIGAEHEDAAAGIAADRSGNIVVSGWFTGTADFGKGMLQSNGQNKDVFALKLDASGAVIWQQAFGDKDHDQGRAVAIDSKGNPILAGLYRFGLPFSKPPVESVHAPDDRAPKPDVFVIKLSR
jgi:hypothetical protein